MYNSFNSSVVFLIALSHFPVKQALKASPASHLVLEQRLKKEDQSVDYHFHTEDLRLFLWTLKHGLVTSGGWATQLEKYNHQISNVVDLAQVRCWTCRRHLWKHLAISLLIPVASDSFLNLSNIHPNKQKACLKKSPWKFRASDDSFPVAIARNRRPFSAQQMPPSQQVFWTHSIRGNPHWSSNANRTTCVMIRSNEGCSPLPKHTGTTYLW